MGLFGDGDQFFSLTLRSENCLISRVVISFSRKVVSHVIALLYLLVRFWKGVVKYNLYFM